MEILVYLHSQRLEMSRVKFKGEPFTSRLSARSKDPNSFIWTHFFTVLLIFYVQIAEESHFPNRMSQFHHFCIHFRMMPKTFRLIEFVFLSLRFLLRESTFRRSSKRKKNLQKSVRTQPIPLNILTLHKNKYP